MGLSGGLASNGGGISSAAQIDGFGTHASRPAAGSVASGYIYFETDTGNAYQSQAGAWVQVAIASSAVASVFGRTGTVVKAGGDYGVADITGAAPLASPTFTGSPAAPTATALDNSTKLATTAYGDAAVAVEKSRAQTAEALKAPLTSVPTNVRSLSADATAVAGDFILMDATAANRTVTLPASVSGSQIVVKKTDSSANTVTVAGTIDGAANAVLSYQNQGIALEGDGSGYQRVVRQSLATGIVDYPATTDARYVQSGSVLITSLPQLPESYGAKGDGKYLTDGAMTSGSAALTSASAPFTAGDVGKRVMVPGAAAAGATLSTTIAAYVSATQVNLSASAGATATGSAVCFGTDDSGAFNSLLTASATPHCRLSPGKTYVVESITGVSRMRLLGAAGATIQQINTSSHRAALWFPTAAAGSYYDVRIQDLIMLGEGSDIPTVFQQAPIFSSGGAQEWRVKNNYFSGFAFGAVVIYNGYRLWIDDNSCDTICAANWQNQIHLQVTSSAVSAGTPATQVNGAQAGNIGTLTVSSTAGFAASGTIWAGGQIITYTGTTGTTFTGCTGGSAAVTIPNNSAVYPSTATFSPTGEWHIRGNTCDGGATGGIVVKSDVGGSATDLDCEITGNVVKNFGWIGIAAEAGWSRRGVIAGNIVAACLNGVGVDNTYNSSTDISTMSKWAIGDNIISCEGVAGSTGIFATGSHLTIEGNSYVGAQAYCIYAATVRGALASQLTVAGNDCFYNNTGSSGGLPGHAINLSAGSDMTVASNTVTFAAGGANTGIYISGANQPNVHGNTVDGASYHGIHYDNCKAIGHGRNTIRSPNLSNQADGSGVYLGGSTVDTRHSVSASKINDNQALDPPQSLAVSQSGSGSTLAGAQSYRVSATTARGESLPSAAVAITITAAQNAVLTWAAPIGEGAVTGYNVYGRTAGGEALLTAVGAGTLTYTDTGAATPSGATAGWNATGNMIYGVNSQLPTGSKVTLLDHDIRGAATADTNDPNSTLTDIGIEDLHGWPGVYAPSILSPAASASAITLAAGRIQVGRAWVPYRRKFTKVEFLVNAIASVNDNAIVGVFDKAGNLLSKSSATAGTLTSTGAKAINLLNPLVIEARTTIYIGFLCPTVGGTAAKLYGFNPGAVTFAMFGAAAPNIDADQLNTQTDMPAVFTFSNSAGNALSLSLQ